MSVRFITADVMEGLAQLPDGSVHCVVTDPPYGETSLRWDRVPVGWMQEVRRVLRKDGSMWVFGSLRSHKAADWTGWQLAQDVVWEKHNGSNAFADRLRRVHEIAVHLYRDDADWVSIYNKVLTTNDARARVVRRKKRPPQWGGRQVRHWGDMDKPVDYVSVDGGPRIMRSVMFFRSVHGDGIGHPTAKPVAVMLPLIEMSCPSGGVVLDPFIGSGTTAIAAKQLGIDCIGIEVNPEYVALAERRLAEDAPLLSQGAAA
jgi:site-specific DNA-methyltransferase (adenine-specific)